MTGLTLLDRLLRDRGAVLAELEDGAALGALARTMAVTVVLSAAVFGAALGLYRGGAQIAFAALKLPLVVLLTASVCAPALSGLRSAFAGRADLRRDTALVLTCLGLSSVVLAATAPVVLLALTFDVGYHAMILLVVACCAAGGAAGLSLFAAALARREEPGRWAVGVATLAVMALVGGQMSWAWRPYLVRPRTPETPFVRALEGGFLDAVSGTLDSVRGVYHREAAPLPDARSGAWELDP